MSFLLLQSYLEIMSMYIFNTKKVVSYSFDMLNIINKVF